MTGPRSARTAEVDTGKRKVIYRQIDQIVAGEASMMPLLHGVTNAVWQKHVRKLDRVFSWTPK